MRQIQELQSQLAPSTDNKVSEPVAMDIDAIVRDEENEEEEDSEESEEQPQGRDTGLDCGQAENVSASLDQLHLGVEGVQQQQNLPRFSKEEQLPQSGSVGANHDFLPPQSRLSGLFPGTTGRPCKVQTNHFPISLKFPEDVIYMYDVCIVPPWSR